MSHGRNNRFFSRRLPLEKERNQLLPPWKSPKEREVPHGEAFELGFLITNLVENPSIDANVGP